MSKWTKEQRAAAEARALASFEELAGKVILVTDIDGYIDGKHAEFHLEQPAFARVIRPGSEAAVRDNVLHWTDDDWIDPYLDLEILTEHPELAKLFSCWTLGHSFSPDGKMEHGRFAVAPVDLVARHCVESGPWKSPDMRVFEITLPGYNGGDDNTDHLVSWVAAPAGEIVEQALEDTGCSYWGQIKADLEAADFILPRDNAKLAAHISQQLDNRPAAAPAL